MVKRYGADQLLEDGEHLSMTGGVALGLFARLPGWLRGRLIKDRHSVANRLQTAGPLGRLVQPPKGGPDGSVESFVRHASNVGAGLYDSIQFCFSSRN